MKRLFALLSLVILVILAGCIGDWGQPTDEIRKGTASGLVIKDFGPDLPEIFSGDSVTFTALVENIGEEDATDVSAKLYGLGTDWSWTTGYMTITSSIPRAQPSMGVPGGQDSATWDVTSPPNLKVDKEYTAKMRLKYSYKTTASGSIKVYDSDYLGTITQEEARRITTTSGLESWTVTNSPITIELAGAARPFIIKDTDLDATISVLISNRGQGYPFDSVEKDRKITIDHITVNKIACTNTIDTEPTLPRTGKKSVSCKFTIDSDVTEEFTTIPIEVVLTYNYYIDSSASVKVLQTLG